MQKTDIPTPMRESVASAHDKDETGARPSCKTRRSPLTAKGIAKNCFIPFCAKGRRSGDGFNK